MGQVTAISSMSLCDHCDDEIGGNQAVSANVQMHDEPAMRRRVWHKACVPADIALILSLERIYEEGEQRERMLAEEPDGVGGGL